MKPSKWVEGCQNYQDLFHVHVQWIFEKPWFFFLMSVPGIVFTVEFKNEAGECRFCILH